MRHKIALLIASLGITMSLAITPVAFGEEIDSPARLKSHVEVVNENIILSDVFADIKRYGDSAIAKSPKPGEEISLPAAWLWRIAKLYRVNWQPTSKLDISVVTRASTIIAPEAINEIVKAALFERTGEDDLVELKINTNIPSMHISPNNDASLRINRLDYDANSGRFLAEVIAPANGSAEARVIITGNLYPMVEAAVPNRRILPGEIIRNSDLDWTRMRARNVNTKAILDASQIIGKSAKRTLVAGKTISLNSIEPPVLVKKNSLVTVTLVTPRMKITTQGKALHNGALEDVIQIRNLQSDIVIEALVTGSGQAKVINPAELAMR